MGIGLTITVLGLIVNGSFGQPFTELRGDYLGQTPPGDIPIVFAPGIVSDNYQQHGIPSFVEKVTPCCCIPRRGSTK